MRMANYNLELSHEEAYLVRLYMEANFGGGVKHAKRLLAGEKKLDKQAQEQCEAHISLEKKLRKLPESE